MCVNLQLHMSHYYYYSQDFSVVYTTRTRVCKIWMSHKYMSKIEKYSLIWLSFENIYNMQKKKLLVSIIVSYFLMLKCIITKLCVYVYSVNVRGGDTDNVFCTD